MAITFYPNLIHYSGFDPSAEPSVEGQGYASSGGETTGAAYDVVDNRNDNVITVDTDGETASFGFRITLTSNIAPDFCIIDGHNLATANAETNIIYDYGGVTGDQTLDTAYSGTLGSALTAEGIDSDEVEAPANDGVMLINFSGSANSDDDWFVAFDEDPNNIPDNFHADVTIGEISLGASFSPAHGPEINALFSYKMPGYTNISGGGQKYGYAVHTNYQRAWRLNWKFMSDSDKTSLENVFKYTNGTQFPFYIDLGEAATPQLYYVRFVPDTLSFTALTDDAWAVTVSIEEEL